MANHTRVYLMSQLSTSEKDRFVEMLVMALANDAGPTAMFKYDEFHRFARMFLVCFGVVMSGADPRDRPPPTNER